MTDVQTESGVLAGDERMLIDGELQFTSSGAEFDVIHPASEEVAGRATDGTVEDMQRAVGAARRAFDTTDWSRDLEFRHHCITQLHAALERNKERLRRHQAEWPRLSQRRGRLQGISGGQDHRDAGVIDPENPCDKLEIAALLTTYARAVDTKDWALYRSVFIDDAFIDYSSAGVIAGSLDEVTDFFAGDFSTLVLMSMHYITNVEGDVTGDTARVRAMFYNPTRIQGVAELCLFGGYYHHELVRTADGWLSRHLREESVWIVNAPAKLSPRRPIDRRPRRFRDHAYHAPCTRPRARGPA